MDAQAPEPSDVSRSQRLPLPPLSRRGFLGVSAAGAVGVLVAGLARPTGAAAAPEATLAGATPLGTEAVHLVPEQFGGVYVDHRVARFGVHCAGQLVRWTLRDGWGQTAATGQSRLHFGRCTVAVDLPHTGYYTLEVDAVRDQAILGRASTSLASLAPYRRPADSSFGVNTHLQPPRMVALLDALGVSWARTDLTWVDIEPPPLVDWSPEVYQADATVALDRTVAHTGSASVKIVNNSPIQANYFATIAQALTVEPETTYTFSAWLKGEDVVRQALQFTVADDWSSRVDAPSGTFDWTQVSFDYTTTAAQTTLNFRLLSSDVTGAAWMDDVVVTAAGSSTNIVANPGFELGLVSGYTFTTFAPYLDALDRAGINPLPILDYANPKYDGGQTPYDDAGRAAFAAYASAVFAHWKGRFRAVEVFNEYNAGWFTTGPASADPTYYARLLAATYAAVKAADPTVQVVGGVTYGTALDWLTSVFEAGGMAHLDVVSNHPYAATPETAPELDVAEGQVTALIEQYNNGQAKPVWISELGWSIGDELTTAGYLVRGLVLALAGGVEKFFWYDLVGDQNFGLLDQDGERYSPKPAFAAYANAIRLLTDATYAGGGELPSTGIRHYGFHGGTEDVIVLWGTDNRDPVAVSVTRPVTLVDVMGAPTVLTPRGGKVHLTLTANPVYLLGAGLAASAGAVSADATVDATAPALVQTSAGTVALTYVLDNSAGTRAVTLTYATLGQRSTVTAAAGARTRVVVDLPLTGLAAGRNTVITWVGDGSATVGRLVNEVVLIDVPAAALGTVGTPDWSDAELALAPSGYSQYLTQFPDGVSFTLGKSNPATDWSYIHPGPDDGWAGSSVHTFTLTLVLAAAPLHDLQLVVYLLDTHNTDPGTVSVALNGGSATTVELPAGGGSGYAAGSALDSSDQPWQFSVPLPAAQLTAGTNAITITKPSGSWMVYDAVGVYPA